MHESEDAAPREVGVGPWPGGRDHWPSDPRLDPELLEHGDARIPVRSTQLFTVDHAAVSARTAESRSNQRLTQPLQHVITDTGLDPVSGDQQVALMPGAIGEMHANTLILFLDAHGALVKAGYTLWQP